MCQAVEMSGEGQGDLVRVLELACSQDPDVMKLGERQLDSWKTEKNFYTALAVRLTARRKACYVVPNQRIYVCLYRCTLQGVLSSRSLDPAVRWMAITNIKNGVDQYWRPGAPK